MTDLHLAGDKAMILLRAMLAPKEGRQIQIRFCWAMALEIMIVG